MISTDLRFAARTLAKAPGFSAAALLTIALGIGANAVIFSVVNAVMLKPLPFSQPKRLIRVFEKNDRINLRDFSASVLNYLSWKEQTHAFESLGAFGFGSYNLTGRGEPEQYAGSPVTPSLLPLLGIRPAAGRSFMDGEDLPGSKKVAMISWRLWKRRFALDHSIVGRTIALNGADYTLIGVAPPALDFFNYGDILTPLVIDPEHEFRLNHLISVVGRIRPGISVQQAQAEMDTISVRVGQQFREVKDWGITLTSFHDWLIPPQIRSALVVLLCAVGLVLLIACANVANLLLARGSARQKELAVRTAMGASRGRLVRQLLTECVMLSGIGGATGLLAAVWTVGLINKSLPPGLLPVPEIALDARVIGFTAVMTLATSLLFGLAPAWLAAKQDLNLILKQASRSSVGGARPRLRSALVAGELALTTMLLIGAGLLMQSLLELQKVRLGFRPTGMMTFQLSLNGSKYAGMPRRWGFYRSLIESLNAIPGVSGTAVSSALPMGGGTYTRTPARASGPSLLPPDGTIPIDWRAVSPNYFKVMETPLLKGRYFNEGDVTGAPVVMLISRETVKRVFGTEDPLGKTMQMGNGAVKAEIVGVVDDVRLSALNQAPIPAMYFPAAVRQWPLMDVVVKTSGTPGSLLPAIRGKVHELDPELPIATVRTMEQWVSASASQPRLSATLLAVFAGLAMLIAAIGVYGVLSYSVNQRTREIGVRMALGAARENVLWLVVRQAMVVAVAGIGIGLAGAFAAARVLSSQLFGVNAHDPVTFAVVPVALAAVALVACASPARRASKIDPMVALRTE